jgi:hypothetical protein
MVSIESRTNRRIAGLTPQPPGSERLCRKPQIGCILQPRGCLIENVFMRNVELLSCIAQVKEAVLTIDFMYLQLRSCVADTNAQA